MKLPVDLSGDDLRKALERAGFVFRRQTGSHMVLKRTEPRARVVVPAHQRIRPGTLRQILREARLSIEELQELL